MSRMLPRRGARLAAIAAVATAGFGAANLGHTGSAHADPLFAQAKIGVGSDTIQDVFDSLSGAEPYSGSGAASTLYTPLNTNVVNTAVTPNTTTTFTLSSWDAIPAGGTAAAPGCITTKLGGNSFDRPNGSSNGINALLASRGAAATFNNSTGTCAGAVNISGQVDFARSSRSPKTTGTTLTFVPFARDAVSVAYYDHSTNELAGITTAQLNTLYSSSTGTITVNGHTVHACLPQSGSGTRSFFEGAIGVTDTAADAAATAAGCNNIEENGANTFYSVATGTTFGATDDSVIPFSVGSWISQATGAALDRSGTGRTNGVDLANIDGIAGAAPAKPYTGTGTSEAPNTTYYQNTTYGRNVFVVLYTGDISGRSPNKALTQLFTGPSASICATGIQSQINKFGFDSLTAAEGTCGATTLTGAN